MNTILVAVIALGVTALVLAGVLFVVSKQFACCLGSLGLASIWIHRCASCNQSQYN